MRIPDERTFNFLNCCHLARQESIEEATLYQEEYAEVEEWIERWKVSLEIPILSNERTFNAELPDAKMNCMYLARQASTEEATLYQKEYAEVEEWSEEFKASLETPIPPSAAYGSSLVPY